MSADEIEKTMRLVSSDINNIDKYDILDSIRWEHLLDSEIVMSAKLRPFYSVLFDNLQILQSDYVCVFNIGTWSVVKHMMNYLSVIQSVLESRVVFVISIIEQEITNVRINELRSILNLSDVGTRGIILRVANKGFDIGGFYLAYNELNERVKLGEFNFKYVIKLHTKTNNPIHHLPNWRQDLCNFMNNETIFRTTCNELEEHNRLVGSLVWRIKLDGGNVPIIDQQMKRFDAIYGDIYDFYEKPTFIGGTIFMCRKETCDFVTQNIVNINNYVLFQPKYTRNSNPGVHSIIHAIERLFGVADHYVNNNVMKYMDLVPFISKMKQTNVSKHRHRIIVMSVNYGDGDDHIKMLGILNIIREFSKYATKIIVVNSLPKDCSVKTREHIDAIRHKLQPLCDLHMDVFEYHEVQKRRCNEYSDWLWYITRYNQGSHDIEPVDMTFIDSTFIITDSLDKYFTRINESTADIFGVTDSLEINHHIQGYLFTVIGDQNICKLSNFLKNACEDDTTNPILDIECQLVSKVFDNNYGVLIKTSLISAQNIYSTPVIFQLQASKELPLIRLSQVRNCFDVNEDLKIGVKIVQRKRQIHKKCSRILNNHKNIEPVSIIPNEYCNIYTDLAHLTDVQAIEHYKLKGCLEHRYCSHKDMVISKSKIALGII